MLSFDVQVVFILSAVFSVLISIVLFSIAHGVSRVLTGVLSFAWAYVLYAVFATLVLLRGVIPDLLSIVAADMALGVAILLIFDGVNRLKEIPIQHTFYSWYLGACLLLYLCFTYIVPSLDARIVVISLSLAFVFTKVLMTLWRGDWPHWQVGEIIVSITLLIVVIAGLIRASDAVLVNMLPAYFPLFATQDKLAFYLVIDLLANIFISLGLIVMIQDDLRQDLEQLASYDSLTGVNTRRVILDLLAKSLAKVRRHGHPVALMMIDFDHFKDINDKYGHRAGDEVLYTLVKAIESVLRKDTYIGRYGGEEFLVIMPDTDASQLAEVSERIRQITEITPVKYLDDTIHCTISIGAISIDGHNVNNLPDPIALADQALYQAKQQGRNRVVMVEGPFAIPSTRASNS